jgi:microsomal epoxide hydrolase
MRLWFAIAMLLALLPANARAQGVTTREGFVTAPDQTRIRFIEAGAGPAMLFVPGWTMGAEIWEAQIEFFSKTHRVIAMDPRGQGGSGKPTEGLHPKARATDIKAVVDQLKLAPTVLVGWSMGVSEVASFVDQFGTGDLSAIVLVDGIAGRDADPASMAAMVQFVGNLQRNRDQVGPAFVRSMYKTPRSEEYLKRITEMSMKTPTSAAVALFVGSITADHRAALARFDRPTLLAVAPGGPWEAAYADMAARMPRCTLVRFEGAGHALFVDQAERFNAAVQDLLNR